MWLETIESNKSSIKELGFFLEDFFVVVLNLGLLPDENYLDRWSLYTNNQVPAKA